MGKYKDTPRYNVVSLRVSDNELQALQVMASHHAVSMSRMMREVIDQFAIEHYGAGLEQTATERMRPRMNGSQNAA